MPCSDLILNGEAKVLAKQANKLGPSCKVGAIGDGRKCRKLNLPKMLENDFILKY